MTTQDFAPDAGPGPVISATDPGREAAGRLWVDMSTPSSPVLRIRNEANTDWIAAGGGSLTPPVTLTGTDPNTTPLSIVGPASPEVELFKVTMHGVVGPSLSVLQTGTIEVAQADDTQWCFSVDTAHTAHDTFIINQHGAVTIETDPSATDAPLTVNAPGGGSSLFKIDVAVNGTTVAGRGLNVSPSIDNSAPMLTLATFNGNHGVGFTHDGALVIETDPSSTTNPFTINQPGGSGTPLLTIGSAGTTVLMSTDPGLIPLTIKGAASQVQELLVVENNDGNGSVTVGRYGQVVITPKTGASYGLEVSAPDANTAIFFADSKNTNSDSFTVGNHGQVIIETDPGASDNPLTINKPGGGGVLFAIADNGELELSPTGTDGILMSNTQIALLADGEDPQDAVNFRQLGATGWQGTYASGTTYAKSAIVKASDNHLYISMAAGNVGHDPTTDGGVHWQALAA